MSIGHFVLVNFEDNPDSMLAREDGQSHSNAYGDKLSEIIQFISLHDMTKIPNKHKISWEDTEFTPEVLEKLCNDIITEWQLSTEGKANAN